MNKLIQELIKQKKVGTYTEKDLTITTEGTEPVKNIYNYHWYGCGCTECINLRIWGQS